jgi:hypothetical protein
MPRTLTKDERAHICHALEDREAKLRTLAAGIMERNPESVVNALIRMADDCEALMHAVRNGEIG